MKETINPMAVPSAASAKIHETSWANPLLVMSMEGQLGKRAMVQARANTARAMPGPASLMGNGMKTKVPAIRLRTRRKDRSVATENVSSPRITGEISEDRDRVGTGAVQHPGKQEEESDEASRQAGHGAEDGVLHG